MFDSGMCTICEKRERSMAGLMPREMLIPRVSNVCYGERAVSYTRMYEARGADSRIDLLIRIPAGISVEQNDYILIGDAQYRVDAAINVIVKRSTRARELSLIKVEDYLDVATS